LAALPSNTEHKYLEGQVVLAGYGTVGKRVADALASNNIPFVVAEENREKVKALRKQGLPSVSGNAADPSVLIQAHITHAALLIIATPDPFDVRHIAEIARKLNPDIRVILRTRSDDDLIHLRKEVAGTVLCAKEELAKGMVDLILKHFSSTTAEVVQKK
jgi:CPA2 family monovalent cation:H+ antiporter-2